MLKFLRRTAPSPTGRPPAADPRVPRPTPGPGPGPGLPRAAATDWERRREPIAERDKTLSPQARSWLSALPSDVRPDALAETFPRIANRLSLVWPDRVLTERYFESLIIDRRGGRRGFPAAVMQDLIRLRAWHEVHRPAGSDPASGLAMPAIDFD